MLVALPKFMEKIDSNVQTIELKRELWWQAVETRVTVSGSSVSPQWSTTANHGKFLLSLIKVIQLQEN